MNIIEETLYNMSTFQNNNRLNKFKGDKSVHKATLEKIKKEVKNQKFTYESFASLFGKTEGWFSHIMTGRTKLTIPLLYEIADKLGVNPASLLPGTNPEKRPEFEEYIRNIIREEIEKALEKK